MIEVRAGTFIEPHEVAGADRFSDEMNGSDLRRVKNFSTSQSRRDSLGGRGAPDRFGARDTQQVRRKTN